MVPRKCPACRQSIDLTEIPHDREIVCPSCGTAVRNSAEVEIAAGPPRANQFEDGVNPFAPDRELRHDDGFDDIEIDRRPSNWRMTIAGLRLAWWSTLSYLISNDRLEGS